MQIKDTYITKTRRMKYELYMLLKNYRNNKKYDPIGVDVPLNFDIINQSKPTDIFVDMWYTFSPCL